MIEQALLCLALNIFHESRGELVPGQYAVAQVTMNRADNDPSKVCQVVYAPKQFSWTHQKVGKRNPAKVDPDAWARSKTIAQVVLEGRMPLDLSRGADHYHTTSVSPRWDRSMAKTVKLGRHVFFKGK